MIGAKLERDSRPGHERRSKKFSPQFQERTERPQRPEGVSLLGQSEWLDIFERLKDVVEGTQEPCGQA